MNCKGFCQIKPKLVTKGLVQTLFYILFLHCVIVEGFQIDGISDMYGNLQHISRIVGICRTALYIG